MNRLQDALHELGPLTESASQVELTCYHEDGRDEHQFLFVGPSAQAIHQAQRRHMVEDVAGLLSRHFGPADVAQVTNLVNVLFNRDLKNSRAPGPTSRRLAAACCLSGRNTCTDDQLTRQA